jgi:1,4-alpha-glucan branching enzyme
MTGVAAGRFINAGASFRLHAAQRRMPQPVGVGAPRAGETRLSIVARDAERVEVTGDFTNWTMKVAKRTSNGVWYLDFAIPPGQYRYSFRIDGEEWRVPAGAQVAGDDFGVKTAWLTVRGSAAGEQAKHEEKK